MIEQKKHNKFTRVTSIILSIKFWYLLLFAFGMVVPFWIQYPNMGWPEFYLTTTFVFLAIILKMILVFRQLTIKQFFIMQSGYMIPYCFMVIIIILWIKLNNALQSEQAYLLYYYPLTVTQTIFYFEKAFICSLLASKKTTSTLQYWVFMMMLLYATGFNMYLLLHYVDNINQTSGSLDDDINYNTLYLIQNYISSSEYESNYQLYSGVQAALQSAKDYLIALIASAIAELLIMMDMLGRSLEKLQADKQRTKRSTTYRNNRQNSNLSNQRQNIFLTQNTIQENKIALKRSSLDSGKRIKEGLI